MSEYSSSTQYRVPIDAQRLSLGERITRTVATAALTLFVMVFLYSVVLAVLGMTPLQSKGSASRAAVPESSLLKTAQAAFHGTVVAAVSRIIPGLPEPPAVVATRIRTRASVVPPGVLHGGIMLIAVLVAGNWAGSRGIRHEAALVPLILFPCSMGLLTNRLVLNLTSQELWLGCVFLVQTLGIYVAAVYGSHGRIGRAYQTRAHHRA